MMLGVFLTVFGWVSGITTAPEDFSTCVVDMSRAPKVSPAYRDMQWQVMVDRKRVQITPQGNPLIPVGGVDTRPVVAATTKGYSVSGSLRDGTDSTPYSIEVELGSYGPSRVAGKLLVKQAGAPRGVNLPIFCIMPPAPPSSRN